MLPYWDSVPAKGNPYTALRLYLRVPTTPPSPLAKQNQFNIASPGLKSYSFKQDIFWLTFPCRYGIYNKNLLFLCVKTKWVPYILISPPV
jgi:hypothetical protein